MANQPDMSAPITRGELHEALETWAGAIIAKLTADLTAKFTVAITEAIEANNVKLTAKFTEAIAASEQRMIHRMDVEIARHTKTSADDVVSRIAALFDPFRDLPARVSRLEAVVFAPKPKRKARG